MKVEELTAKVLLDNPNLDRYQLALAVAKRCEIVMEDFENLDKEFELLIEKHNPNYFEKKSTYTQLEIYSKIMGSNEILNNILNLLKGNK